MVAEVQRETHKPTLYVLTEWRCWKCNRLLGRVMLGPRSILEVKCEKCGTTNERRAG